MSTRFIVRLSDAELADWKAQAAERGVPLAELVRERMRRADPLDAVARTRVPPMSPAMVEVRRNREVV